jgi:VanZ family protein
VSIFSRVIWSVWLAAVVVGSVLPGDSRPMQTLGRLAVNDKWEHFLSYALLALLLPLVLRLRRHQLLEALIALVAMGCLLELVQLFVPGRSADILDALADLAGVVFGAFVGVLIETSVRRYRSE